MNAPLITPLIALASLSAAPALTLAQPDAPATTSIQSAPEDMPTGFEVLDRYVEALGGHEAYKNINNVVGKGVFQMDAMGIEGEVTRIEAKPNKLMLRIVLGMMGEVIQACDGETAWTVQPGSAEPVILKDDDREDMLRQADFMLSVEPKRAYSSATNTGTELVEGSLCFRVEVTNTLGENSVHYYDTETFYRVKSESNIDPETGVAAQVQTLSDYREVDGGLVYPFVINASGGQTPAWTITMTNITIDAELDDAQFSPPAPALPEGEI